MNNECRYCHEYIRWVKVDGKWKPYDTNSKVHNCPERWKARRAAEPSGKADAKKAAANDTEKEPA